MKKLNFSELGVDQKRLVFRLADQAGTLTPNVLAAASHVGELHEAEEFFRHFPKGSTQHAQLSALFRSRPAGRNTESILDCIARIAPDYVTSWGRIDAEFVEAARRAGDELLADLDL